MVPRADPHEAGSMHLTTRLAALAAPLFLLAYGVFRYVDGRDGEHGPGVAWNIGHASSLAAFVCFRGGCRSRQTSMDPAGRMAASAARVPASHPRASNVARRVPVVT